MYELPLFPLNTVLFPGMPIHLHIFEERYKEMINLCISENRPFGVVLIQNGNEVGAPAEPQPIGCTAQIAQMQPLDNGRMNLVAIGKERFHIASLSYDRAYLMGNVEAMAIITADNQRLSTTCDGLRDQLTQYLETLSTVGQVEFDMEKLPDDAVELSYLAATLLQVPVEKKQEILKVDQADALVNVVYKTCREELAVLKAMLATDPRKAQNAGPFSLN